MWGIVSWVDTLENTLFPVNDMLMQISLAVFNCSFCRRPPVVVDVPPPLYYKKLQFTAVNMSPSIRVNHITV